MNDANQYLYALAKDVTSNYTHLSTIRSAMVTGSTAKALCDNYSDIDMTFYYEKSLPEEETLHDIRRSLGGSERKWTIGNREEGSFAEAYHLNGVEVQIGHTTIEAWEKTIEMVLKDLELDNPIQKALEGTLACKALYGPEYIARWKSHISDYPAELATAMVAKHGAFFPIWGLTNYFRGRDATIWTYQIMVEATQNIIGLLAAVNKLYFTTFQFKRMHRFIDQMKYTPPNLANRIENLFAQSPLDAATDLEKLIQETFALVEQHIPDADVTRATARIGWRHAPWEAQPAEHPSS